MLYVTITDAEKRSKRTGHKTDNAGKAASAAVADFLKGEKLRETAVLGVVIETNRKAISEASICEALEQIASAEAERAAE